VTISDIINAIGGSNGGPYCRHLPCQRTARPDSWLCTECMVRSGLGAEDCTACYHHTTEDATIPDRGRRVYRKPPPS